MLNKPTLIKGGQHSDDRGTLTFLNDFDMGNVKRMYFIQNENLDIVRAWRGHKIEQRWFYVVNGSFLVKLVCIDDWQMPDPKLEIMAFELTEQNNQVLHIPVGYASSVQALTNDAKLLVFADYELSHAKNDDYLYAENYFKNTQ